MNKLQKARDVLASFEQNFGSDASLRFLAEGLYVLGEVANHGVSESEIARRISNAYFEKTYNPISAKLKSESETEPNLVILLNILREFEYCEFREKGKLSDLKVNSFVQWIDGLWQGCTLDEKKRMLQNLQLHQ